MKKIVLISGKAQHGKDTTAKILKSQLEAKGNKVCIMHFADAVKFFAKEYLGWDGVKDEKGRTILQQLGTEKMRDKYPNFWVDIICTLIDVLRNDFDYFIIADCRFKNEVTYFSCESEAFAKNDIVSVRVHRWNFENSLTAEQRQHRSETGLDDFMFDYFMYYGNGEDNVRCEVDIFVRSMLNE